MITVTRNNNRLSSFMCVKQFSYPKLGQDLSVLSVFLDQVLTQITMVTKQLGHFCDTAPGLINHTRLKDMKTRVTLTI